MRTSGMTHLLDDEREILERLAKAEQDGSFASRINTWLTAGDGRRFCASVPEDIRTLLQRLSEARAVISQMKAYEAERLKESTTHALSKFVLEVKANMMPEYIPTWEAGRACGFHAGYERHQKERDENVRLRKALERSHAAHIELGNLMRSHADCALLNENVKLTARCTELEAALKEIAKNKWPSHYGAVTITGSHHTLMQIAREALGKGD